MKDPAFLFYSQDFLIGTAELTNEEIGQFIKILAYMHQKGRLDEKTIRLLVGSVSDNLRLKFGIDENGKWFNKRLEMEIEKRKKFTESRRINGSKGGRPKKGEKPLGYPTGKLPEDEIEDENLGEEEGVGEDGESTDQNPTAFNPKNPNTEQKMRMMWEAKFDTYLWEGETDRPAMAAIKNKLTALVRKKRNMHRTEQVEEKHILDAWEYVLKYFPPFWHTKLLKSINENFNTISAEAKKADEAEKAEHRRALS